MNSRIPMAADKSCAEVTRHQGKGGLPGPLCARGKGFLPGLEVILVAAFAVRTDLSLEPTAGCDSEELLLLFDMCSFQ